MQGSGQIGQDAKTHFQKGEASVLAQVHFRQLVHLPRPDIFLQSLRAGGRVGWKAICAAHLLQNGLGHLAWVFVAHEQGRGAYGRGDTVVILIHENGGDQKDAE